MISLPANHAQSEKNLYNRVVACNVKNTNCRLSSIVCYHKLTQDISTTYCTQHKLHYGSKIDDF